MQSLQQGALLKKLAIGLSVMGGALICLPIFAQAKQIIAQVEPRSAEIEPMPETSPNPELDEEMFAAGDIVDVAINSGSFATLITALETAGLVDTLSGEGPYTVFAPTDE
ncbi:MAG: fasciclin domain-containing protein, partial [Pseudanabaenales cyanobacterium]|nr:fasciclin domain-containing protein [Pseudanabaenales cyanobacterium]